jgi:hypothetical protein
MSIPDHARVNFETLLRAATDGNLALLECTDAVTGESRYVICAVAREGDDYVFTPFGASRRRQSLRCLPAAIARPGSLAGLSTAELEPRFATWRPRRGRGRPG